MRRVYYPLLVATLLTSMVAQAARQPSTPHWWAAYSAYQHGDYRNALVIFQQLAYQGNAWAENYLGVMYTRGQGVPKSYAKAIKWYHMAAQQGFAAAEFNLGAMYHDGEGVPKDYSKAAKWLHLSAEQGYEPAQMDLSSMYDNGEGVSQNYIAAYKWLVIAKAMTPATDPH